MARLHRVLAVLVFLSLVSACSLDYGALLGEDLDERMPDTVIFNFVHTIVENGSPRFRLSAERAEAFRSTRTLKLVGVGFVEYERVAPRPDGSRSIAIPVIAAEGRADSAVFNTETENADLMGNVRVRSASDGVTVTSAFIHWDGEARLLEGGSESVTTIQDDDGSRVSGAGFKADAARRSFEFTERTTGSYSLPAKEAE
ncbi:MAG: LPS export ABC transporter periplasmic protein LptC [Spirochaetota bacterium]